MLGEEVRKREKGGREGREKKEGRAQRGKMPKGSEGCCQKAVTG